MRLTPHEAHQLLQTAYDEAEEDLEIALQELARARRVNARLRRQLAGQRRLALIALIIVTVAFVGWNLPIGWWL